MTNQRSSVSSRTSPIAGSSSRQRIVAIGRIRVSRSSTAAKDRYGKRRKTPRRGNFFRAIAVQTTSVADDRADNCRYEPPEYREREPQKGSFDRFSDRAGPSECGNG